MLAFKHAFQLRAFSVAIRGVFIYATVIFFTGIRLLFSQDKISVKWQKSNGGKSVFLSDEQYIHAKALYENITEPTPLLADLSAWALQKYGIQVIDYICDQRIDGQLRMMPVLWADEDVDMFRRYRNYNPKIQKAFAQKFAELCRKYKSHKEYTKPGKIFIAYESLKEELEKR